MTDPNPDVNEDDAQVEEENTVLEILAKLMLFM